MTRGDDTIEDRPEYAHGCAHGYQRDCRFGCREYNCVLVGASGEPILAAEYRTEVRRG